MDLSFAIPSWNRDFYVKNLLESICNQIKSSNMTFEVVIVDKKSDDNTLECIKSYQDKIENLRVINVDDVTLNTSKLRNIGAKYSSGHLITFID